jgi:hypothetical protein
VGLLNSSLLAKWRWRLIQKEQPLWKRVLIDKYGPHAIELDGEMEVERPRHASRSWKELMMLELVVGSNWFSKVL